MLQVAVARFPTPDDAARAARVVHDFEQVDRTTPLASDPSGHRNRSDRQGRVERLPHAGAAEAELLRDDFVETTREMYPDLVEDETVPQNISGTRCWSGDVAQGRVSVCLMVYGRYMAEFSGLRPVGTRIPRTTRFVRCHSGWPPST
ncbi:hypothetical protein [Rhodococcus rhodochrous]|uniref:hypothetical protein n=1 Tax=Rhodococcus rhodochrous TaxID=1829 RepID=UPI0023F86925